MNKLKSVRFDVCFSVAI